MISSSSNGKIVDDWNGYGSKLDIEKYNDAVNELQYN